MRHFLIASLVVICLIPGTASSLVAQTPDSAEVMLEAAKQAELLDGDLDAAIAQYEAIVSRYPDRRSVVAEALLRIGNGYEKLGQARAREVYERLVRDYADQTAVLASAREGLSRLTVEPAPSAPAMTVRELMRSGEQTPDPAMDGNFAISDDGQLFVYTDWDTGDLATLNIATGETQSLFGVDWASTTEFFESPVLAPGDERVGFVRVPNARDITTRIDVSTVEGGDRRTVYDANDGININTKDWSPDGAQILFSSQAADRSVFLATVSLTDQTVQRLVTLDWTHPRRAQYSPDGRFIAYDSTKSGDSRIYLMSADGAEERVLVDSPAEDDSPLWTPDGRFLLFRSNRSGQWDLFAVQMHDGQPAGDAFLIKSNLGAATRLRGMTTDGQIVVHEQVGGREAAITERITARTATAPVRVLPKVQTIDHGPPSFSPDGTRLAFVTGLPPDSNRTIRITDLEGKVLKDIPIERRFRPGPYAPIFSPDGTKLAMRVYDAGGDEPRMMVLSAETGTLLKVFSPLKQKGHFYHLGWSRDSGRVYALLQPAAGGVFLVAIDVDTEQVVESTALPRGASRAQLSPSGDHLLMLVSSFSPDGRRRQTRLVVRSLEDGSDRLLTEESSFRFGWDFDSRRVFYMKGEWNTDEERLYSMSLETGEETVLVEDMQGFVFFSASPDGKYWGLGRFGSRAARVWALENFLPESPAGDDQTASR